MSQEMWNAVDGYITDTFIGSDAALESALEDSAAAGLPAISVSPPQGKMLMLLARLQGARQILEIGTLGGYSTIWLGRGLGPGGRLITLELEPTYAEVARKNVERARLSDVVEVRVGPASDSLAELAASGAGPFDLIFIDADKEGYPDYFVVALSLSRRGTLIVADNVVREGEVIDPSTSDTRVQGIRRFNELVAAEPRVTATAIQTVGTKGYDGFAFVLVTD